MIASRLMAPSGHLGHPYCSNSIFSDPKLKSSNLSLGGLVHPLSSYRPAYCLAAAGPGPGPQPGLAAAGQGQSWPQCPAPHERCPYQLTPPRLPWSAGAQPTTPLVLPRMPWSAGRRLPGAHWQPWTWALEHCYPQLPHPSWL